jgi:hypothetical protein
MAPTRRASRCSYAQQLLSGHSLDVDRCDLCLDSRSLVAASVTWCDLAESWVGSVVAHLSPVARMEVALAAAEDVNKAARRRRWTAWGRATLRDEYFGLLHEAQNPPEHRKKEGRGGREHGVCEGLMAHLLQRADDVSEVLGLAEQGHRSRAQARRVALGRDHGLGS